MNCKYSPRTCAACSSCTGWAFPTPGLTHSVTQRRASYLKKVLHSLLYSGNRVMVMRKLRFRSTDTWLEIRSAVLSTRWPKRSSATPFNWSQLLNWSQAQPNLFVFSVYGAGDGNRTHVRGLGSFYTAIVRRPLVFLIVPANCRWIQVFD